MMFKPNEAALIVEALRGLRYHEDMPASHLWVEVSFVMMEKSLHKHWGVDSEMFIETLINLDDDEAKDILQKVSRLWQSTPTLIWNLLVEYELTDSVPDGLAILEGRGLD